MGKRRQQDFNKTQMKPGRTIAKRKNVTNTSFKAKKITLPSKGSKHAFSPKTIPDCLKIIKGSNQNAVRLNALDDLNKLIALHRDTLSSYLSEMLECVLKLFLDNEDSLRNAATTVLENILQSTNDLQIQSFVPRIISVLSCAMTNINMRVKEHSLKLLTPMLKLHPDLICNSMSLLNHLLQMLIGSPRTRTHTQAPKQNLSVMYSDGIYSPHWRIHLLGHINCFLKGIVKNKSSAMEEERDEQDVYWDSESPLYLPIYAGSGLKPYDVEKCYSNCISAEELCDDSKMVVFIENILHVFPAIFAEEMALLPKSDDHLLDAWTISSLNILFQVLCTISEWLKITATEGAECTLDTVIGGFLKDSVHQKERFPFKNRGAVSIKEDESIDCVQLNLSICYLYCTYLLELVECKQSLCNSVFSYVRAVFRMSEEVKFHSVPMLVKILRIFFTLREKVEVSDFLCDSLFYLCSLLKISDRNHPNRQLLTSLFKKITLDPAYYFVAETDAMRNWFKWLLKMLCNPRTIDKKLLGVTKKIANRRFPCFQKFLMQIDFSVFKAMLKYNDEDIRDTAIFLLYNMEDINTNLLDSIARVILTDSSLPKKFVLRLIRKLISRFSEKPEVGKTPKASIYTARGVVDIVQFLLNVAIDSFNINNKKFIDYEANEYTRSVKIIQDATSFHILPSLHWKEHSALFNICERFLVNELPPKIVNDVISNMFKEVLDNYRVLPMHTVIAIFKLYNQDMCERGEDYEETQMLNLRWSALLTTSVLATMSDDDWYLYNVKELTDSIELRNDTALQILNVVEFIGDDALEGLAAFHILRVCNFLFEMNLLDREDFHHALRTIEILKEKCSDKTIGQQPIYMYLYNNFSMYP